MRLDSFQDKAIKDLCFIRDAYKNLSQNGADAYRIVGEGIDCAAEVKTQGDLYRHYAESLDKGIVAMEKQISKKPIEIKDAGKICPTCGYPLLVIGYAYKYCDMCGQRIDWGTEHETSE